MARPPKNPKGTALYLTLDGSRAALAFTADPVSMRIHLQNKLQAQLLLHAFYCGKIHKSVLSNLAGEPDADGAYVFTERLREYLAGLPRKHFSGKTTRVFGARKRIRGERVISARRLDNLPNVCGIVAAARVLDVDFRTVKGWVQDGLPFSQHGGSVLLARESLREWLGQRNILRG